VPYKKQKIEKIFFTIGEVAGMLGVTPSSIRYWESNFNELAPQKSSGGTRLFSQNDIEILKLINYLVKERGLTIKGAQMKLKHNREDTVNTWDIVNRLKTVREKLIELRNEMES
jgi:DNA-binding transcriptional MerR regulator